MLTGDIYEPGKIRLIETPEPEFSSDGISGTSPLVLFEPHLGCLCGSDLPFLMMNPASEFEVKRGHSLHEMIGQIVATTGSRFSVGTQVLCVPDEQRGLSERFCISESRFVAIAPGLSDEQAVLAQPLGTVICALRKLGPLLDLNIAIIGQGPIGQLFCSALSGAGARRIIAIDRLPDRLAVSARMGATDIIDAKAQDPVDALSQATNGALADLVILAVNQLDDDSAFHIALDLSRAHGRILLFGLPQERVPNFNWHKLQRKNLSLLTSIEPSFTHDFPLAMQWIAQGRIDVRPLITHHFPLSNIQNAFDIFGGRLEGALKVFIEFPRRPNTLTQ